MPTFHIHIRGLVQGVGFRPFVFRLAQRMGLCGWASNTANGVHLEINADADGLREFLEVLEREAPALARIAGIQVEGIPDKDYSTFEIRQDAAEYAANLLLSPDFALCTDCREELSEVANRRFSYPFITCTCCGPRYSISSALPFDRERTSMKAFKQCAVCQEEYGDPTDRRYFSQTNSCPSCGVQLKLFSPEGSLLSADQTSCLQLLVEALVAGKIVALKGIGGYLLMVDATSPESVRELRRRKHRPTKPFAVLYPDLATLKGDAWVSTAAEAMLLGPVSPVVLLPLQDVQASGIALEEVAPGLREIGAMLPYAPLLEVLMQWFPRPVIATSGNISNSPIVFRDEQVPAELGQVVDMVLGNNREIIVPQDDSVMRFGPECGQPILLRRSRGLAPTLVLEVSKSWKGNMIAMGADLKSAFALLHEGNTYYSQYLGDLDNWQTQANFRLVLGHLRGLFRVRPERVLADAHPGYFSRALAVTLSEEEECRIEFFQHHEAHFAAVLAEHQLLGTTFPVLGVVFDGAGWGRDGSIWGGEFFLWENQSMRRIAHLENYAHLAGDKMAREPRLPALTMAAGIEGAMAYFETWFAPGELQVYLQLLNKGRMRQSSSMGRVFDAVAACAGFGLHNSFEGESALRMEAAAGEWFKKNGWKMHGGYICHWQGKNLSIISLLEQVLADVRKGILQEELAAKFHLWAVYAIEAQALYHRPAGIAFSGGVFQNAVLVDLIRLRLGDRFNLFFHRELSPNDENIALGQLALCQIGGHALEHSGK